LRFHQINSTHIESSTVSAFAKFVDIFSNIPGRSNMNKLVELSLFLLKTS